MISTLYKFPWFSVKLYTIRQIQAMFDAYKKQLDVLIVKVDSSTGNPREVGLDNKLLMDFVFAGLNTPGFSERERADIVEASQALACGFRISKHARYWPFQTLTAHPAHLSDQDIGMWFEILNIGMGIMESQNRKLIGIEPYLEVIRDPDGHVLFMPTETGLNLKRGQFSILEKRFMNDMMKLGWDAYMGQMGVGTPTHVQHHFNNDFTVGAAHVNHGDPLTGAGSSNTRPGGPLNNNGQGSGAGVHTTNYQTGQDQNPDTLNEYDHFDDEDDFEGGGYGDNVDDPEKAEKAMREVLRQVSEAPPARQQASMLKQSVYDTETEGLGAGLQNIGLAASNDGPGPTIVGQLPQHRPVRSGTVLGHPFNPETPAFEPPPGWKQRRRHTPSNSDSTLGTGTGTVFGGSGLGNGDFTSPQRISTARSNNKGKGKDPAAAVGSGAPATATAAGIRLQPAAPIFGPPLNAAFGRADAAAAQPNLFQGPKNREHRGITIRSPDDGNPFATLQSTPVRETGSIAVGGPGGLTLSPGSDQDPNKADGIDEFLDDLFGETTSQADRVAMRTPVMTPATTPRGSPLRRMPGRVPSAGIGPIEDDFEDSEVVSTPVMPSSSPSYINYSDVSSNSDFATDSSPPYRTPPTNHGPPEDRGPGSGWEGYTAIPQEDYSPKRGLRLLTTPGFGTALVGTSYAQRMTNSETTAEERGYRMHQQYRQVHIEDTIDEGAEYEGEGEAESES
ncbi:uncharacterized protein PV07_06717 [Cladophialophora immunda]|uniref:Uncharacterized protein n=1 Tax=Cladophialophora immunda TaxID=569365 RepID=A0A0D2CTJ4_9EURO|nr:uncharacterized protein PV07_06717 [Cladophialophora immunda]KIW26929.1 hypothetical protein PV07_06717 [Cladophialophora immunda]